MSQIILRASISVLVIALHATSTESRLYSDAFIVNYNILTYHQSDPIISGGKMSDYVYVVTDGDAFSAQMALKHVLKATGATCDKKIDLRNFW